MIDHHIIRESAAVLAATTGLDGFHWHCRAELSKYDAHGELVDVLVIDGNLATANGANAVWTLLTGGAFTPKFDNANAYLAVGDGNGSVPTPSAADTDLTAPTNKLRKAMDASFPAVNTNSVVFQSTFGGSDANFTWNEWGVFNAAAAGTMLNHKGIALGTKVSGSTWVLKVTLSLS